MNRPYGYSNGILIQQIRAVVGVAIVMVAYLWLSPPACFADAGAFVRVNQLGYELGVSGRAELMVAGAASGAKFSIKNAQGEVSYTGEVGSEVGRWAKYFVYALDFTITTPGTYTIVVTGPISATSPAFKVDRPANLYSGALANALSFYQNQRDGANFIPSQLRTAPAHVNDEKAKVYQTPEFFGREGSRIRGDLVPTGAVIDASGGWWDAGDCLKFVQTSSYTVALMLVGVRDFPDQLGAGSTGSNFTNEARFGLDWLFKMWDDNSRTLYYQVGIGSWGSGYENDHSVWRQPQDDDTYKEGDAKYRYIRNRPVLVAGPAGSKISPNLAGRLAGDFALCSQLYQNRDMAFANRCLAAAEHIFELADTSPSGNLLTAGPHDFYPETEWRDDLEFGATELYLATLGANLPGGLPHNDPTFYLKEAARWAASYVHSPKLGDTLNLSDISGLAHFDLYRALVRAKTTSDLAISPADVLADMRSKLDRAVENARKDPFGYGLFWGHGDTPAYGAGLSVMASEYGYLTHSDAYANYARNWISNILGANAWGSSFIVGDGTVFPHCIHHQVANLVGSKNGEAPILAGALVEGPIEKAESGAPHGVVACPSDGNDDFAQFNANRAAYKDNARSYSTVEPAIDLTAPTLLMFAWQIAGRPAS